MHRQTTPPTEQQDSELVLITSVSVAEGRIAVPFFAMLAFVPVMFLAGAFLQGSLSRAGPYAAALPFSAVSLALSAFIRKRRVRTLTIERRGDEAVLDVERTRIRLRFPLRLLGEQQTYSGRRVNTHWLYLQAVGQDGASVIFVEQRSERSGRESGWLSDGVDRTLPHAEIDLDAPAVSTIVELRAAIEKTNASLRKAAGLPASDPAPAPPRVFVPPGPRPVEQGMSLCVGTMDGRSYEVLASSDMEKLWLVERELPLPGGPPKRLDLTIDSQYGADAADIRVDERGLSVTVYAQHKRGGTLEEFSWFVPRGRGLGG